MTASLSGYALDFPHWLIALISERLFGWKSTCGCYLMVLALVYVQGFKYLLVEIIFKFTNVQGSCLLGRLTSLQKGFDLPVSFVLHTDCPHYWRYHLPGRIFHPS